MASIETYWNLRIIIDPYGKVFRSAEPHVASDLVLFTHEGADQNIADLIDGQPTVVQVRDTNGNNLKLHHVLDRPPNRDAPTWEIARPNVPRSRHAVVVRSISTWQDDADGDHRGAGAMLLIEVDGVRIAHFGSLGQCSLTNDQLSEMGQVDVLLIPVGAKEIVDGPAAARIVRQIKPRVVVPIHYRVQAVNDPDSATPFLDALPPEYKVAHPVGNTLAVRALDRTTTSEPRVVLLKDEPWRMPDELATLFVRKEAASRASQAVFATLSTEQMNFRPANGTHTPRWNAEHMMGRELGFFSQIFSHIDAAVPHMDLNPKQMPPDYVAAHPDWSGEEEGRQMERVTAFTRRFAYLLDGIQLDDQAPGSRWALRALLVQMESHYEEHTENVKKKFDLPEWPTR